MRDFSSLHRDLKLREFLESPLGTLYFTPVAPGAPRLLVRRFDGALPASLVGPFVALIRAAQDWVERSPELARLVRVEQPSEVGKDFVARKHHIYGTSLAAYADSEDPPEPPPELARMRSAFQKARGKSTDRKDSILETVLARSLLEPTGKTYFNEDENRFVVVEPKPTPEEVQRWAALMPRSGP